MLMEVQCPFKMTKETKNLFDLTDKVAIISGSSRGIGLAIATAFAEYGAHVVLSSRSQGAVDKAAKELSQKGYSVMAQACHIGEKTQRENLVNKALEKFGRIDNWVNNVGGSDEKNTRTLIDTPDEIFRSQLELNLTTAFQGAKAAAKKMEDGGCIINIASGAGMRGSPYTGPYAAAKAGMLNMTETLAIELAPKIRVNAVSPGPVVTEAFDKVLGAADAQDEIAATIPLGFLGTPDDIAHTVVFLSSSASRWITGRNILVAGGRTHRAYQYQQRLEEE